MMKLYKPLHTVSPQVRSMVFPDQAKAEAHMKYDINAKSWFSRPEWDDDLIHDAVYDLIDDKPVLKRVLIPQPL